MNSVSNAVHTSGVTPRPPLPTFVTQQVQFEKQQQLEWRPGIEAIASLALYMVVAIYYIYGAYSFIVIVSGCRAGYKLMNPNSNCLHMDVGWSLELNGNYI